MIKTTVISNEAKPQEIEFPLIAKSTNGTVVLLTSYKEGVVLEGTMGVFVDYTVGMYRSDWCFNIDSWEILPNDVQIVLQNDQ